jgi:hypothetical protein
MGIALRDQDGHLRRSEDLLADVADAFARIEDPAERVRLAFKLFDSEGVGLVNLLSDGSGALDQMRDRARDLGIVLDEHLVRDAERARTELDTLAQVVSANLTRAALEAAPVIADLSSWLADGAGKAGIAWERLFDAPENKNLRTLRYELDLDVTTGIVTFTTAPAAGAAITADFEGAAREEAVVGETPNLAARLQLAPRLVTAVE